MLGFTSGGCFITGIVVGFLFALLIALAALFYFKPGIKAEVLTHIEQFWGSVKENVDTSIDAVKKAPSAEPALPEGLRKSQSTGSVSNKAVPSARNVQPKKAVNGIQKPKEIKISW